MTTPPNPAPAASASLSPAERVQALHAQGEWRACLLAIDEALAQTSAPLRVNLLCLKARILTQHLKLPSQGLEAIEAAHRIEPANRTVLQTLARVRLMAGAASGAFAVYKRLHRGGDPSGSALRGMFNVVMGRKRFAMARRLAPLLEAAAPASGALARDLAETALAGRDAEEAQARIDAARAELGEAPLETFQITVNALKRELASPDTMAGYRHLAIVGAAYSGSTTCGLILGSADGFAFAGETHWLTNVRTPPMGLESILTTAMPRSDWPIACRVCGRDCACFDPDFRLRLAADKLGWYAKVSDRLGVKNLVTADKNLELYWERDPLFRLDCILLYKTPIQQLRSTLAGHLRRGGTVTDGWVGATLDRWAQKYLTNMKTIRQSGRRVTLNWEAFVAEPARHMERLSFLLNIRLDPQSLQHVRLGHFIGGSTGVDVRGLKVDPKLTLHPSTAPDLPEEVLREAIEHPFSNWMSRVLDGEYRRDFPA